MKTHWKMFLCGGLLKLFGDLTALVGPISITQIVDFIRINLSASSLSLVPVANSPDVVPSSNLFDGTITRTNITDGVNDIIKIASTNNYNPTAASSATMMSTLLINENTEIYYPTWMEFVENGWIMALLVLFASLAQGSFSQASTHIVNMIGIRLRTSLQSLVYRKTLLISSSCFVLDSMDDGGDGGGGATTVNDINDNSNGSISCDANEVYRYANNEIVMNDEDNGSNDDKTKTESNSNDTIEKSTTIQQQRQSSTEQTTTTTTTAIDTGTITNLMSEDALNVMSFFWIAHYVWAIPLKV